MTKFMMSAAAIAILASPAAAQAPTPATSVRRVRSIQPATRAEVQARSAAAFARLDTNHDGFIGRDELNAIEAQRAQKAEQRAARFDPSKLFDRLDLNHDGQVGADEMQAASLNGRAHVRGLAKLLARADANKDGVISRAEFEATGQQMKARLEHASLSRGGAATRMFDRADADKDGRVSLVEMQQAALAQFDRIDLNHDGTITPDERQQARQLFTAKRHPGKAPARQ